MKKATAVAPANIAFIKYWGRKDANLRLPYTDSISMNLSGAYTVTTVEFSPKYKNDDISIAGDELTDKEKDRIVEQLDRIRNLKGATMCAKVVTKNTFPKSTGIASSASGLAALTEAAAAALDLDLSEKDLSVLARIGSGSACRSIPDGFVKWKAADTSEQSYAYSLYPHAYWDLRDILLIVENKQKDVSSSRGHDAVGTSPFYQQRLNALPERIMAVEQSLKEKNFRLLGEMIEQECLDMHHVMQTQQPPLYYWVDATKKIMDSVISWRKKGLPVYFTIDAGPNVHLICEGEDEKRVVKAVNEIQAVKEVIVNKPAQGAHITSEHLF